MIVIHNHHECKKCGQKFKPTLRTYVFGAHTITRRYLKCLHCGEKSFLQKEAVGMKSKINALVWVVAFIIGLIMILNKIQISRYVSDLNGVFTAGIILSVVSGLGLLFELYGRRK